MTKTLVLVIGLEPDLVDFSTMPHMNAEKVRAGLAADQAKLAALGYEAELCLTDLGDTAADVVATRSSDESRYADPPRRVIEQPLREGAGTRTGCQLTFFSSRLSGNSRGCIRAASKGGRICCRHRPTDTAEAVQPAHSAAFRRGLHDPIVARLGNVQSAARPPPIAARVQCASTAPDSFRHRTPIGILHQRVDWPSQGCASARLAAGARVAATELPGSAGRIRARRPPTPKLPRAPNEVPRRRGAAGGGRPRAGRCELIPADTACLQDPLRDEAGVRGGQHRENGCVPERLHSGRPRGRPRQGVQPGELVVIWNAMSTCSFGGHGPRAYRSSPAGIRTA